ncbi:MAG TPA: FHA domain-containing protein [Actinocatenispora sp.]
MTRPDDEYPPLDVTSTLNLGALEDMLDSADADVVPARLAGSLPPGTALLVVRRGPNAGARFLLDHDVTTSGRHPDSDIFLDDVTVSRRHAEFHREAGVFTVRDVGSLNGTYVNRERVETATLSNGDEVQIGKFRLVLIAGPKVDDA